MVIVVVTFVSPAGHLAAPTSGATTLGAQQATAAAEARAQHQGASVARDAMEPSTR